MKSVVIKAIKREATGKKDSKKLRVDGFVPCVLYGGKEPVHFYADFKDFRHIIYTPNVYIIELDIEGQIHNAIIQDTQWHPVEEQLLHVDFLLVNENKPVRVNIPVHTVGLAKGIKQGGKLKSNLRKLKVKAFAKYLPDTIEIDVENLEIGQSIKVGDLNIENLEFLDSKFNVVVAVDITRAAKAAAGTGEAGAEGGESGKEKTEPETKK
jgi:large subunit ribosomal protein L25